MSVEVRWVGKGRAARVRPGDHRVAAAPWDESGAARCRTAVSIVWAIVLSLN